MTEMLKLALFLFMKSTTPIFAAGVTENKPKLGQLGAQLPPYSSAFVGSLDYTGFALIIMRDVRKNPFPK